MAKDTTATPKVSKNATTDANRTKRALKQSKMLAQHAHKKDSIVSHGWARAKRRGFDCKLIQQFGGTI
jgi:hypothetical protein